MKRQLNPFSSYVILDNALAILLATSEQWYLDLLWMTDLEQVFHLMFGKSNKYFLGALIMIYF